MKLQQTKRQRTKAIVHFVQGFLIFVAGCLTLAVMTKDGSFGGQTGFYFALCFFTIPAITYQVMVPIWSRAWRFNNVWAFATIDILFAILWFAASIAVAVWNANGIAKAKDDNANTSNTKPTRRADTKSTATTATFGYGSESKLHVSQATVGLGIVIFFLFAYTSYVSIKAIIEYRRTGVLPSAPAKEFADVEGQGGSDPSKDAWSASTDNLDNDPSNDRLAFAQNADEHHEGLLNRHSFDAPIPADDMHPGRRYDAPSSLPPPVYDDNVAPSALSPTGLPMSPNGRVQFPEANYSALR